MHKESVLAQDKTSLLLKINIIITLAHWLTEWGTHKNVGVLYACNMDKLPHLQGCAHPLCRSERERERDRERDKEREKQRDIKREREKQREVKIERGRERKREREREKRGIMIRIYTITN